MIVTKDGGHNEMCCGYSYNYKVELKTENPTVNDAVREIKAWQKKQKNQDAWGIYVNNEIVYSTWLNEQEDTLFSYRKMYKGDGSEKVLSITGSGGWYCGINFYISAETAPSVEKIKEVKKIEGVNYNEYNF